MNSQDTNAISLIDQQIKDLEKMKAKLLKKQTLSQIVSSKKWLWVIDDRDNTYYQVRAVSSNQIGLSRYGEAYVFNRDEFNNNFRIASSKEFKQHIEFCTIRGKQFIEDVNTSTILTSNPVAPKKHTIDPTDCDFYMVTVTGQFGSKVRHDDYSVAIKEATRLAKKQNHTAWVTGVVAVVEPIKQEVQVKVIKK